MKKNIILNIRLFSFIFTVLIVSCQGQEKKLTTKETNKKVNANDTLGKNTLQNNHPLSSDKNTVFKQTHSNLNGKVTEFVRKMYQDSNGNFWFGTNGNGIIRYDNRSLKDFDIAENFNSNTGAVREIAEDKEGNIWLATSSGLIKFDGEYFKVYSKKEGLPSDEVWGLIIDNNGLIWLGTTEGVYQFDGEKFTHFSLPKSAVKNPEPMLSNKLVFKFLEDKNGMMWLVADGNGVYKYNHRNFSQLTEDNGLTDNHVFDLFQDRKGNIWIGTFNGGVSKYDGSTYTNFTKDGFIEGPEAYNFCEDQKGNIWFSAENYGVYRYDGREFFQYTTQDGLATNTIQSIYEDHKGQIWLSTWEGISLYDGNKITNVTVKEPWTR